MILLHQTINLETLDNFTSVTYILLILLPSQKNKQKQKPKKLYRKITLED